MLKRVVGGQYVLFYKPTPANCADCHGSDGPAPPTRK
jgi:mono/diheme cytochrome c family protein